MKTERRHELQQNELDQMLAQGATWFQKHGMTALWTLAGIAVVVAAFQYIRGNSEATIAKAYDVFGTLSYATKEEAKSSIDQLKALAAKVKDDAFVLRSLGYQSGLASMHAVDSTTGAIDAAMLAEAKRAYEETLSKFANVPLEVGAALFGLATIEENYFALDHDASRKTKAKEHLERIVADTRLAGTPISKSAVDRLNRLDQTFRVVTFIDAPPPPPAPEPVTDAATGAPAGEPAPTDVAAETPAGEAVPVTGSTETKPDAATPAPAEPSKEAPAEPTEAKAEEPKPE